MIVPDNTIAFLPIDPMNELKPFDMAISTFLMPLNTTHERYWFNSHFYRCLPLSIGNMQGFVFYSPFDFDVLWNGGNSTSDITINAYDIDPKYENMNHVHVRSEFGHGIFTFHFPVILKTPPGVNILTIAPPNYPTPGFTPMTGSVETDNLRFGMTLNFKIDYPNTIIRVEKNYPIMGLLPIPRYFCDSFQLINGEQLFTAEEIEEEKRIVTKHSESRLKQTEEKLGYDRLYYRGMDIEHNIFSDHQLPKKKNA